mmetsp:Transcript_19850/g.40458  ORF Transcript_19850/g.40458 Transcript_19850/m.40458 type:complete len:226 (-) Transcript_19850:83-760(-)
MRLMRAPQERPGTSSKSGVPVEDTVSKPSRALCAGEGAAGSKTETRKYSESSSLESVTHPPTSLAACAAFLSLSCCCCRFQRASSASSCLRSSWKFRLLGHFPKCSVLQSLQSGAWVLPDFSEGLPGVPDLGANVGLLPPPGPDGAAVDVDVSLASSALILRSLALRAFFSFLPAAPGVKGSAAGSVVVAFDLAVSVVGLSRSPAGNRQLSATPVLQPPNPCRAA